MILIKVTYFRAAIERQLNELTKKAAILAIDGEVITCILEESGL